MYEMMDGTPVMWGMGLVGLLLVIDLVLVGAAAAKYLFFDGRRWSTGDGASRRADFVEAKPVRGAGP